MNINNSKIELVSEIKSIKNNDYDCLQSIVLTVATFWDIDPTMMFSLLWGFKYYNTDNSLNRLGDKIDLGYPGNAWEFLHKYNGIKIKERIPEDPDNIELVRETIIDSISCDNQIALNIDAYVCPWNLSYQKTHYPHYCIVTGFCDNDIVCIDPFSSSNEYEILPIESLIRGYNDKLQRGFCYLEFEKDQVSNTIDLLELIEVLYKNIKNQNTSLINSILSFSNDILHIDYGTEIDSMNDINSIPLVLKVNSIGNNRKNVASYFKYLSSIFKEDSLLTLSSEFTASFNSWYKVKLYLIMYFTTQRRKDIENISVKLKSIAEIENKILGDLGNIINSLKK